MAKLDRLVLALVAAALLMLAAYNAVKVSTMSNDRVKITEIVTTVEINGRTRNVTTPRYEGMSIHEWLQQHKAELEQAKAELSGT